jgi:hypothetical protein
VIVIPDPPVLEGAVQFSVTCAAPPVAVTAVGAPGVAGVTKVAELDQLVDDSYWSRPMTRQ